MNDASIQRLMTILGQTVTPFRKMEEQTVTVTDGPMEILMVANIPHVSEMHDGLSRVDFGFYMMGVDRKKAEPHREELIALLNQWPGGIINDLSIASVGGVIGAASAIQLFALGKVMDWWDIQDASSAGVTDENLIGVAFAIGAVFLENVRLPKSQDGASP